VFQKQLKIIRIVQVINDPTTVIIIPHSGDPELLKSFLFLTDLSTLPDY
jgi:hypothetical protein